MFDQVNIRKRLENSIVGSFLKALALHGIDNLAVLGGAVRDVLLGYPVKDLDVAIMLRSPTSSLRYINFDCDYSIAPIAKETFQRLAYLLESDVDALVAGGVKFKGSEVDIMGLRPMINVDQQVYPDVFVTNGGQTHVPVPGALTINAMAVDTTYNFYGCAYLDHLFERRAVFINRPELCPHAVYLLTRILIYCKKYALGFDHQFSTALKFHLKELHNNPKFVRCEGQKAPLEEVMYLPESNCIQWDSNALVQSMEQEFIKVGAITPGAVSSLDATERKKLK